MKNQKTLEKVRRVEEISFRDLSKLVKELGGIMVNGEGSCMKIELRSTVTTLHFHGKILKHGVVRTFKNTLVQLKII